MRLSIVIAGHNEGENLLRTIQSCADTIGSLRHEFIVADDASTDGSIERALKQFPRLQIVRHPDPKIRLGPSPTKDAGARAARGDVLLFLDAHCKPEPGAIRRLFENLDRTGGQAILTPAVPALNVQDWRNRRGQTGHGYSMELLRFNPRWIRKCDMIERRVADRILYESPGLIGCCLMLSADLYEKLRGFDPHMFNYGVEDLDFGLKSWLMGHPILHDPDALIGHRFQRGFAGYKVAKTHVIVNQLRSARKNLSETFWNQWLDQARRRLTTIHPRRLSEHHEGLWARAWLLFDEYRASVEEERAYLLGRRQHDELWYSRKFHLDWPTLGAPAPESKSQKFRSATARALAAGASPSPSPSPSASPSPSPAPCEISGPDSVCVGREISFSVDYEGEGEPQWDSDDGDPNTGSGTEFTTTWFQSGNKTISVTCPYPDGDKTSSASVAVIKIDKLEASPAKVCIGSDISVEAVPSPDSDYPEGSPTWTFTLKPEDSEIEDPPAGERSVTVTPDVPGTYVLEATCGDSKVNVSLTAVAIEALNCASDIACLGSSVQVFAVPTNDDEFPDQSPTWEFTDQPAGSNLPNPSPGDNPAVFTPEIPGNYTLQATCGESVVDLTMAVVAVDELVASDSKVCVGSDITVDAIPDPSDGDFPQGSPTWSFTQKPEGSAIQDPPAGERSVTVTPDVPGEYTLSGSCNDSCAYVSFTAIGVKEVISTDGTDFTWVGDPLGVKAIPDPEDEEFPEGSPKWQFLQDPAGNTTPPADGEAEGEVTPEEPGEYELEAACGDSTKTVDFTACKLEILDRNDQVINDTTVEWIVGKQTIVKARVTPEIEGITYQWEINGQTVKTYTQDENKTTVSYLDDNDKKSKNPPPFYWIDGFTEGDEATYKIKVTATKDGKTKDATVDFSVWRPTSTYSASPTAMSPRVDTIDPGFGKGLMLVFGNKDSPGMYSKARVTAPSNGKGHVQYTQLLNAFFMRQFAEHDEETKSSMGIYVLDNVVSYTGDPPIILANETFLLETEDSPGIQLGGLVKAKMENYFTTYLMYKPDDVASGSPSIFVTLRKLTWYCKGAAHKEPPNNWVPDMPGDGNKIEIVDSVELPQWLNNIKFIPYQ